MVVVGGKVQERKGKRIGFGKVINLSNLRSSVCFFPPAAAEMVVSPFTDP